MATDEPPTQLSLQRPESFRPIASAERGYVPVLQSHAGERKGLLNASDATWASLTPLIEIVGPKSPGHDPFNRARVLGWVRKVSEVVGPRPCFLDTVRLGRLHPVKTGKGTEPVLETILNAAHRRGMNIVPVLKIQDKAGARSTLRRAVAGLGTGVAMRYPLLGIAPGSAKTSGTILKEALEQVELDAQAADLLIDLEYISEDVEIDPKDLAIALDEMLGVGDWRNVVLMGTAMARTLGGGLIAEGTVGRLPRREWDLWKALRPQQPERMPTYGDYAVQHPDPPAIDESGGPGMRANIRYTLDEVTLVPRGRGALIIEGSAQYRQLCEQIVASDGFAGESYTWGDRVIADCADGGEPGNQTLWRGAGTSHHLRHVVDQLARIVPT